MRTLRPRFETLEDRLAPAVFNVLNTNDTGAGSLRQAITDANTAGGQSTILFQAGVTGTIILGTALPDLDSDISLLGPGANELTVAQSALAREFGIFHVTQDSTVESGPDDQQRLCPGWRRYR